MSIHYVAQVWLVDTDDVEDPAEAGRQLEAENQAVAIAEKTGPQGPSFIVAAHSYPWLLDMLSSKRWNLYEHVDTEEAKQFALEQSAPVLAQLVKDGVVVGSDVLEPVAAVGEVPEP